ncbi:MAG: ATP-binding cassette subfamily B multidrug efflux pump [bacterium]|jgi:ATP-binding cassette subfamily B multidrug efflux pump
MSGQQEQTEVLPSQITDWMLLKRFFHYLKPQWAWGLSSMLAVPFAMGATLFVPWFIIKIIDTYISKGQVAGLYEASMFLSIAVVVGFFADLVYSFSLQRAGLVSIYHMRNDLYSYALNLPRRYFDQHPIGTTLTRLTSDIEAIGESLAVGVLATFTDILKTVGLLAFMFYLSWKLTLVLLFIFPVLFFLMVFFRKRLRYFYNKSRESLANTTGFLQECLNGVKTIQLYASEKKVFHEFRKKNYQFFNAQTNSNVYDASLFSLIDGVTSVTIALILWYGANQFLLGFISLGILIAFINTLNRVFIPIREFTQQIAVIQRALAASEHIEELFQEELEDTTPLHTLSNQDAQKIGSFEELVLDNVYFRYSEQTPNVLRGVSFTIKKGQRIAIVGTTGSGKSTIVKLLTQAYTNYQGSIKLNGVELSDIPGVHLQSLIAMMQQDVYLFNESIAFNIGLNRKGITPQKIEESATYVYADEFIKKNPEGYQFKIENNGQNLSAGEAQLLSFARTLASDSEVIILDEATSSVDSITESLIQKAIEKVFEERTVIAIAHRLSTIQHSDLILVMQHGQVVESGNHQTLKSAQGVYADLLKNFKEH